jgi:predicted glycosyltransferase
MKVIHYCQHVLGIGHYLRSLEICRAMAAHEVVLVTGGPRIDRVLAPHVREVRLPDLQMNTEFKGLFSSRKRNSLEQIKAKRQKRLLTLFEREKPDIFLVELYPFGRKAFRFELDPVLEALANKTLPPCGVICSVRDILVEKEDTLRHESRAVNILNRYFDAVLVHADPHLAQLNETFEQFDEIEIPVFYTGYIARKPAPDAGRKIRRQLRIGAGELLIVASAGGGNVGADFLEAIIRAFSQWDGKDRRRLRMFTGPFMEADHFNRLSRLAGNYVTVERFTADFLSYLAGADLSVSMGGYNTTMNILASQVPALVWPFPQNREQRLRAERLAKLGALKIIEDNELQPDRLAAVMDQMLRSAGRTPVDIDLNGAANTAKWIGRWRGHDRQRGILGSGLT